VLRSALPPWQPQQALLEGGFVADPGLFSGGRLEFPIRRRLWSIAHVLALVAARGCLRCSPPATLADEDNSDRVRPSLPCPTPESLRCL